MTYIHEAERRVIFHFFSFCCVICKDVWEVYYQAKRYATVFDVACVTAQFFCMRQRQLCCVICFFSQRLVTSFHTRLSTVSSEQTSLMKTEETKDRKEWRAEMNDYNWILSENQMTEWLVMEEMQEIFLRNVWDERIEEVESLREEITRCLNEFELK